MPEKNQNFGPWLQANTSNLVKRTVFWVASYEDEVQGEFASNSPKGRHEEWDSIRGNSVYRTTTEVG